MTTKWKERIAASEILPQQPEARYFQQAAVAHVRTHLAALQLPRVVVGYEYRVQPGLKRGIDVRLGAVADHPRLLAHQRVLFRDRTIGGRIFFGDDFGGDEMLLQSRSLQLARLLG